VIVSSYARHLVGDRAAQRLLETARGAPAHLVQCEGHVDGRRNQKGREEDGVEEVVVELELQAACGLMDTLTKRIRQSPSS
jgi:hypothetical protein